MTRDGAFFFDRIILAGPDDVEPEGTIAIVRPDGAAETRRPDGTIISGNPFPKDRVSYYRRWAIFSSNESDIAQRRLTLGVRVVGAAPSTGKVPEQVTLFTVLTNQ